MIFTRTNDGVSYRYTAETVVSLALARRRMVEFCERYGPVVVDLGDEKHLGDGFAVAVSLEVCPYDASDQWANGIHPTVTTCNCYECAADQY
jgi:hypothetical protein